MRVSKDATGKVFIELEADEQECVVETVTHLVEFCAVMGKDTSAIEGWLIRYQDNNMVIH